MSIDREPSKNMLEALRKNKERVSLAQEVIKSALTLQQSEHDSEDFVDQITRRANEISQEKKKKKSLVNSSLVAALTRDLTITENAELLEIMVLVSQARPVIWADILIHCQQAVNEYRSSHRQDGEF